MCYICVTRDTSCDTKNRNLCYQKRKKMKDVNLSIIHNRTKRGTPKKAVSVEFRFTLNRERKYVSTGIKVCVGQFSDKRCVIIRHPEADELNKKLDIQYRRMLDVVHKMNEEKVTDLSRLSDFLRADEGERMSFAEYCEKRKEERNVCENTRKRYAVFIRFLKSWGKIHTFADCNVAKVRAMDEYLHKMGLSQGTVYNYHKYLKLFIHDAVIDGYITENPYTRLPFTIARGEKQYVDCINEEQFDAIKGLRIKTVHIRKARDLFLFQCYTGLAYSDLMSFDYDNCEEIGGKLFYHAKRTKTDTDFVFQLLPPAVALLEKYDYQLPKLSNQKYNDYLKVVGGLVGVPNLHSHMGRATAATLFLSKGMPINIVARVLGHTTLKQTTRYARTLNKDVMGAFDKLEGKM